MRGIRMSGEQDVAGRGFKKGEATLETLDVLRIPSEEEAVGGDGGDAIGINDVEAVARLAGFPGPTGAAGRVAWGEVGSQRKSSDAEGFAVVKRFHLSDGCDATDDSKLRVVVGYAAFLQNGSTPIAGHYASAAETLQFSNAPGVVKVDVGIDDQLHVFDAEAEGSNARDDLRDGFGEGGVDENMSGVGGDENGAQAVRADVEGVAVDAKGGLGSVPGGAIRAGRSLLGGGGMVEEEQRNQCE